MSLTAHHLASGVGWRVDDVVCSFGPQHRAFEERHEAACVAVVTRGTFQYRSPLGSAVLAPGALLLGNHGYCFECRHEHAVGDRCIAFQFTPEFIERVASGSPGVRNILFTAPRLPPHPVLLPIVAAAEAACTDGEEAEFEELALQLAATVMTILTETNKSPRAPSRHDESRITNALRQIEARSAEQLSLSDLAAAAAMSPYHFLRTFSAIAGMTPYQFILLTRLRAAAVRLRGTSESVAMIAFAAGFGDLSTFNRRFHRLVGLSPSAYRTSARRSGKMPKWPRQLPAG
jgi:AraC-like DNA-binding protein